jgi:hypothetical protein
VTRVAKRGARRIVHFSLSFPDEDWLQFDPDPGFDQQAPQVAAKFATTQAGRELLTQALIALNHNALGEHGTVVQVYAWVPDRAVGQVKIFAHVGIRVLASLAEATPEAFAARDVQKDAGHKFKVFDHDTGIFDCPAGRMVMVICRQLQRWTDFATINTDVLIFPPVPDLCEAFNLTFFSDDLELMVQMGTFARLIANSVKLQVE